jgi:hypothetical protein
LISLADSEGVALIRLGEVNLDRLTAFSKFNLNFIVLPNPISYLLSESLSSLWRLLHLWEAILRVFSNLSNFLLNWANNCFTGLGSLPAFLAAWKSAFTVLCFLYLWQSLVACVVCAPPCFLHSSQRPLKTDFLGSLLCGSSTGPLGSCLLLVRSFLVRWRMGFLMGTYALNSFERSLKRMHVYGSHALFLQVVLILPLV